MSRAPQAAAAARRMGGFSLAVILTTVVSVVTIPFLIGSIGGSAWGVLVLVQTVGQLGAIVAAYGYGAVGAATVAGQDQQQRVRFYRESLRVRVLLYLVATVAAAAVLFALTRGELLISVLGAAVYLLPALGAAWFFTGQGRPALLLACDAIPNAAGTLLGVVLASFGGQLWWFLAGQGIGFLAAVCVSAAVILRGAAETGQRRGIGTVLREQRHAVTASLTTSLYVSLPIVAVGAFLPSQLEIYGMADRLFRYASIVLAPIQQWYQSWVPAVREELPRRARSTLLAGIVIGASGGVCIAVLSPWASTLLSAGAITVPWSLSIPLGVAFIGVGAAALIGYAGLVALRRVSALATSTVLGAVIGAPLVVLFAILGMLPAMAWSVALSELAVAGYQARALLSAFRLRQEETP